MNRTRRYKKGLSGDKPRWLDFDKEGRRAQEQGFRDYLRNEDLADRIAARSRGSEYDGYQEEPHTARISKAERTNFTVGGIVLLGMAFWLLYYFVTGPARGIPHGLGSVLVCLVVLPSGIFFWPGVICLWIAWKDPSY